MKCYAIIIQQVADLRREKGSLSQDFSHDDLRESQLLFGEKVEIIKKDGMWNYVHALEQPRFNKNNHWQPYPGWLEENEVFHVSENYKPTHVVKSSNTFLYKEPSINSEKLMTVSMGSYLNSYEFIGDFAKVELACSFGWTPKNSLNDLSINYDEMSLRNNICFSALRFLKTPYLWGGRAFYQKEMPIAGVDCSGLINLLFRTHGVIIPRDAHDQFLLSKPIVKEELKPGDLVFLKRSSEGRIHHVMLYMGRNNVIEAPFTGEKVRLITMDKRILKEELTLFGTLLNSGC